MRETPEYPNVKLERRLHEQHRASFKHLPDPEVPFRASDVVAYLDETERGKLVPDRDPNTDRLAYEQALIGDLGEAEMNEDDDKIRRLRKLILAGSLTVNKNRDPKAPAEAAEAFLEELEAQQDELRRHGPDDAEQMEEYVVRVRDVLETLKHDIRDEREMRDVLRTVEDAYQRALNHALHAHRSIRKRARRHKLPRMRLIRDALYMQALFPHMRERHRKPKPRAA
jgi:hypothetical protein